MYIYYQKARLQDHGDVKTFSKAKILIIENA